MSDKISPAEWEWFGIVGHCIIGQWCRFHLLTQVGNVLVSTIGEYVHPRNSGGSERTEAEWLAENWPGEEIGYDRKYETMVFRVGAPCSDPECDCGIPAQESGRELDADGYNSRKHAQIGHYQMCERWASLSFQGDKLAEAAR